MSERGTYVVIEGIDGSGKTELASRLVPPMVRRGHSVTSVHEPSDKFLRAQFSRLAKTDSLSAVFSLTVDRAMLRPGIERALDEGDVVIQDRSFYSTLAYQFPSLSADDYRELERIERTVAIEPDLVLYLDAPIEVAMNRVAGKSLRSSVDDEPYLSKVRWKFDQMFQAPRWVRLDARGPPERSMEQALNALMSAGL